MKNEAYDLLQQIIASENGLNIHFYGSSTSANKVAQQLQNGDVYLRDAPDLLIKYENDALIVEHFEFDSYHVRRKKGSLGKREISRIDKIGDSIQPTEEGAFFHDQINADTSYSDYLQNVTNVFCKHYNHILMYKENLLKDGLINATTSVKVMFLIEDTTTLGAMALDKKADIHHIFLSHCKPFLDLLKASPDVNYILACSSTSNRYFSWFIDCSQLDAYYEKVVDYENMDFLDFTPQVTGFKILVPEGGNSEKE